MSINKMSPEVLRKMQLLELDMLCELDRVCRENNIKYTIFGGTLLGAVRHKGFIPWDDDADVCMLREDYEKFKTVASQLKPEICYFQDHSTDSEYRWGYGKLRRTNSVYVRVGQEHLKCKTGIFIDIFPMDDIPLSIPGQVLQDWICFCLRKILWAEVAKKSGSRIRKMWFSTLSAIPINIPFKGFNSFVAKSKNGSPNRVRALAFPATGTLYRKNPLSERYGMPKAWFLDRDEYLFEGKKLYGAKDYDALLKYTYGDYMQIPPESERDPHSPFSILIFPDELQETL